MVQRFEVRTLAEVLSAGGELALRGVVPVTLAIVKNRYLGVFITWRARKDYNWGVSQSIQRAYAQPTESLRRAYGKLIKNITTDTVCGSRYQLNRCGGVPHDDPDT